jgi:hypothetical protein
MGEIVYDALCRYYEVLHKTGYYKYADVKKLLVLIFYWNLVYHDYRGLLSKADYSLIEQALNCLYGSTCLIPYPDYLKMGKLHLGEMTEMAQRIKNAENTKVVKVKETADGAEEIFENWEIPDIEITE